MRKDTLETQLVVRLLHSEMFVSHELMAICFQCTFFRAFESFLFIMKMMLCMSLCGEHVYMYVCTHTFYDLLI